MCLIVGFKAIYRYDECFILNNKRYCMGLFLFYSMMFSMAYLVTKFMSQTSFFNKCMDMPNHRSMHSIPTPRGGGIAFILSFYVLILWQVYTHTASSLTYCLIGSGGVIALIGFLDDLYGLSALLRLIIHFMAAIMAMIILGNLPQELIFKDFLIPDVCVSVFSVFYLVWLVNLYNFMDGLDGLAALESIFVCLAMVIIYLMNQVITATYLPLGLAFAVAGFLMLNRPPASIFMGDVGSGFIGMTLGLLSLNTLFWQPTYFWCWLILLGIFIVDTSVTLLQRALHRQRLQEAHRTHAYQQSLKHVHSQQAVIFWMMLINIVWLFPLALLVGIHKFAGFHALIVAYVPLIVLAVMLEAGKKVPNDAGK